MKYPIYLIQQFLKVGMFVKSNADADRVLQSPLCVSGMIGEINVNDNSCYIFNNQIEGHKGSVKPNSENYKFSWYVILTNHYAYIEFFNEKNESIPLTIKCENCQNPTSLSVNVTELKKYLNCTKIYCNDCSYKFWGTCCMCERKFLKETMKLNRDGLSYCKICYNNNFMQCNGCDEELNRKVARSGSVEGHYCDICWTLRFNRCEICSSLRFVEQLLYNKIYEVLHCQGCTPTAKYIKHYQYSPSEWSFKQLNYETSKNKKIKHNFPLFLGVELEVEPADKSNIPLLAMTFRKFLKEKYLENIFYIKSDGSIKGFEIVTQPFSLKYSHKNLKWYEILKWLKENRYTSYKNNNCGLHIHIDKNYFTFFEIAKMRMFFSKNHTQLRDFSRRDEQGYHYCKHEEYDLKKFLKGFQEGRYWSLNINSSKNTLEIRLFKGTLNYDRFLASMQFVEAVSKFIKEIGIMYIHKKDDSWDYFIKWCRKQTKYNHFEKFVRLNGREGEV